MKQRFTQAKKANRLCIRYKNTTSDPVWLRRLRGIYGADFREFDRKYPRLEQIVSGFRQRLEQNKEKGVMSN